MPSETRFDHLSLDAVLEQARALAGWGWHSGHDTARAITAANLDTYEAAVRTLTEFEWMLARSAVFEPISSMAASSGSITRDLAAVQLSSARWIFDV